MTPPDLGDDAAREAELAEALSSYERARDWDDPVREAWVVFVDATTRADKARVSRDLARGHLESAREAVARVQASPSPVRGQSSARARQWHEASVALQSASKTYQSALETAHESERAELLAASAFEHQRDQSPYVAALWRRCKQLGAVDGQLERNRAS
jgi:hypothetical protein